MTLPNRHSILRLFAFGPIFIGLALAGSASEVPFLAPNANALVDQPYGSLELDNPLTGTERIVGHPVIELRDAAYLGGNNFQDWTVGGTSANGGYHNEIWLRGIGAWAQTTTTVPSEMISIHFHGDGNDGIGEIEIDGVHVATVDMYDSGTDNVLVVVRDLPLTTHTIRVEVTAFGHQGGSDVAIIGGTALDTTLGESYCTTQAHSGGVTGKMSASGSSFAMNSSFRLVAEDLPPNQNGYFITSMTQGFVSMAGGSQGNLCILGTILRFNAQIQSSGPFGTFAIDVDLANLPLPALDPVMAGETWNYQAWFRDQNPQNTSNFTDGLSVMFF